MLTLGKRLRLCRLLTGLKAKDLANSVSEKYNVHLTPIQYGAWELDVVERFNNKEAFDALYKFLNESEDINGLTYDWLRHGKGYPPIIGDMNHLSTDLKVGDIVRLPSHHNTMTIIEFNEDGYFIIRFFDNNGQLWTHHISNRSIQAFIKVEPT